MKSKVQNKNIGKWENGKVGEPAYKLENRLDEKSKKQLERAMQLTMLQPHRSW